jgi:hypothetical protein
MGRLLRFGSAEHPYEHSPERPVLLTVDQQFAEGPGLPVAPELADRVGSVEVCEPENVDEFGASRRGVRGEP